MYENGTYNPKMGRPTTVVNHIRENMSTRAEIGPEQDCVYPTVQDLLTDAHKAIEILTMEIAGLNEQIEGILCLESPQTSQPCPGPRVCNSNISQQVGSLVDKIEELTDRVNRIRRRVVL